MSYYLARRNKETGKFELQWDDAEPKQYYVLEQAISAYELSMTHEGQDNVMLLEAVALDIKVTITEL
jgi:hypothetical protein